MRQFRSGGVVWAIATAALLQAAGLWGGIAPALAGMLTPVDIKLSSVNHLLQPIAVFGEDDRGPVPPSLQSAQEKIGLLYNGKAQIVCSAFCVAPDIVATAAHCLFRTAEDRPPALADFVFARSRKQAQGISRIAGQSSRSISQHIISGNMQIRVRPPIDAANDWALIRLAAPTCDKGSLPIKILTNEEIARAAQDKKVFQLSYHRDYANWDLAYSQHCEAGEPFGDITAGMIARDFTNPQALILHRCDTGGASSGSPLLLDGPEGPSVIGINVGTYVLSRTLVRESGASQRLRQDVIANTAVNAAVFQPMITALREARLLEGVPQVKRLQQLLGGLHHYEGPIDGAYGTKLRAAIQDFETAQGLTVTGLASQDLLNLLEKASAARYIAPQSASPPPPQAQSSPRAGPRDTGRETAVRR